jgi:hypothetical protein
MLCLSLTAPLPVPLLPLLLLLLLLRLWRPLSVCLLIGYTCNDSSMARSKSGSGDAVIDRLGRV